MKYLNAIHTKTRDPASMNYQRNTELCSSMRGLTLRPIKLHRSVQFMVSRHKKLQWVGAVYRALDDSKCIEWSDRSLLYRLHTARWARSTFFWESAVKGVVRYQTTVMVWPYDTLLFCTADYSCKCRLGGNYGATHQSSWHCGLPDDWRDVAAPTSMLLARHCAARRQTVARHQCWTVTHHWFNQHNVGLEYN